MKCDNCGKEPATVHLTEIDVDGQKHELDLCEECAQKLSVTRGPESFPKPKGSQPNDPR